MTHLLQYHMPFATWLRYGLPCTLLVLAALYSWAYASDRRRGVR